MNGLGLWNASKESAPIALTGVRISSRITALGQRTLVEQVFTNRETQPIEAIYTFPLPDGAAVCGFEAITGERVLTGAIEELGAGMEQYEQAVGEGHGAFMAELWRPDVFSTRIGNLKPGQAVLIRLTYISDVDLHEHKLRASFPTTIAPRYATATGMDPVDAAMDADALNPPHVLSVPYGLELSVEVDLGLPLKSLGSPTHGVRVERGEGERWKVTLAAGRTEMNRNVVIEADLARAASALGTIEEGVDAGEKFAAVTFQPEFEASELGEAAPREIVFVLDCSGSMGGSSIEQAKRALALCLKCLNEGDRFNICRFGSTFELMQPESIPYTQRTLDAAMAYVNKIDANLGGTELHAPLQAILAGAGGRQVRDIILLTDGQVSNEPAIIGLASTARGRARIFAFGIGPASSEFLVRGLANATAGAAAFIAQEERIEDHVMRMFARIASPRLDAIDISWQGAAGEHRGEVDMEPRQVASLFDGEPLRIAARLRGEVPREATLSALWNGTRKTWTVALVASTMRPAADGNRIGMIGASWARQRLADLERGDTFVASGMSAEQRRNLIVDLSKRYGILSRETTLIAVEHRSLEERTSGKPAQRRVPVMLARGWGGLGEVHEGTAVMDHLAMDAACAAPMSLADTAFGMPAPRSAPAPAKSGFLRRMRNQVSLSIAKFDDGPPTDKDLAGGSRGDSLQQLLMRQSAEGYFDFHDILNEPTLGGKPWSAAEHRAKVQPLINSKIKKHQARILDTSLVLRALQECFPEQRDLWIMAAKKALRWLKKISPEVYALHEQAVPMP